MRLKGDIISKTECLKQWQVSELVDDEITIDESSRLIADSVKNE